MKSSRWPLAFALTIVGAGVVASGVAYLATLETEPAASLSFVPSSATLVGQLDVRALASSPLADTWSQSREESEESRPADAVLEAIGIDVLNDLDYVTFSFAGKNETGEGQRWGVIATGSFDTEALVQKAGRGRLDTDEHAGTPIYRFLGGEGPESAMAFTRGGSMLLLGETTYLREMLDAGSGQSPEVKALVESFGPEGFAGESFWLVGSSGAAVSPMLGDPSFVPPLESFAVSGRLDAELTVRARGRASDSDSAQQFVDVLRGLVALGRMNAGATSPELVELAEAVSIDRLERDVEIHLSVPYETIRKLSEKSREQAAEERAIRR